MSIIAAPKSKINGGLRGSTLVLLRWAAIFGQTITVLLIYFGLGFDLPLKSSLVVIAISAWLNVFLTISMRGNRHISDRNLFAQLLFDLVQLAILIGLTGGLSNPFLILFAAPVVVAMTALRLREAAILFFLVGGMMIVLAKIALPLPLPDATSITKASSIYQFGLAIATLITIAFTGIYVWRVSTERNRMEAALAATEAVLAHEQRLAALGGLAAATAHELGTPLGTIQLVAKELNRGLENGCILNNSTKPCRIKEDLDLILSQASACRQILGKLSDRGAENDPFHAKLLLSCLLEEVCAPKMSPEISLSWSASSRDPDAAPTEPELQRQPEIFHALTAFIENAVSFANTKVDVSARWDHDWISITICDDGPGFDPSILERLGDPYITTRQGGNEQGQGGLGLGFFISKNLIERTGGQITCGRSDFLGGAMVQVVWSRASVEIKQADSQAQ